jgi:hypothetical protein
MAVCRSRNARRPAASTRVLESDRIARLESGRFEAGTSQGCAVAVRAVVAMLLLGLVSPVPQLLAQGQILAALHGVIKDEQGGVLPGAVITLTPLGRATSYSTTTDDAGYYVFTSLPPGEYELRAELTGFSAIVSAGTLLRAGLTASLDLTMKIGAIGEVVTVSRAIPLLDSTRPTQSVSISGEFQRELPLSGRRDWAAGLQLAPGVTTRESIGGGGRLQFFLHGSDSSSLVLQLDGADAASPLQSSSSYTNVNLDAIDDVQIKTAAVDASVPLGQGAVLSVVTKSGTDDVHGTGQLAFQPRRWNGSNLPGGTSPQLAIRQPDVSLGGPLRRGRAWVFGSYRYGDRTIGVSRTASDLAAARALDPTFTPLDSRETSHAAFVRLDGSLSRAHRLSGFYEHDTLRSRSVAATTISPSYNKLGGALASARLDSTWSNRLTTRVSVSRNTKTSSTETNTDDEPQIRVYRSVTISAGQARGVGLLGSKGASGESASDAPASKLTVAADATYLLAQAAGMHQFESGLYLQPITKTARANRYVNGGAALEDHVLRDPTDINSVQVPFHRRAYDDPQATISDTVTSDLAAYIQDVWRPTTALTISAGVRVDRIVRRDRIFDATTQSSVELGPRLGGNLSLGSDGRTRVRASWGRVHETVSQTTASIGAVAAGFVDEYDTNADGLFDSRFVTPTSRLLTADRLVDRDRHQPFINEVTIGIQREWRGAILTEAGFVRREYRDRTVLLETNAIYDNEVFVGVRDESQSLIYLNTNNQWNWPVVTDFQLLATTRKSSFNVLASYVRQWRHLAGTWHPTDSARILQPNAFPNPAGIGNTWSASTDTNNADSLSGSSMLQPLGGSQWHDHAVRLGMSWSGLRGLSVGMHYAFQTGAWSGPIYTRLAAPDLSHGPGTIRLSNGRMVSNPLATTFRFAYPTRGDGQLKLPSYHSVNLRVGKRLSVPWGAVDAYLEGFNLTNHDADEQFAAPNWLFDPAFGTTTQRQQPRAAQFVIRTSF